MISRNLTALVAASLIVSSSAAVAQSAQPLSLANSPAAVRAGADLEDANELSTLAYVGIAVVLGVIIIAILVSDDDDEPESP